MIDVSGNKPLLSPTINGQIWTLPNGTWLSLVKQELADALLLQSVLTSKGCELALDLDMNVEP